MVDKPSRGHTRSRWFYAVGPGFFLLSEFMLRDVLLPTHPTDTQVGVAIALEWLVFLALLVFWIPRVEGDTLRGIGLREFRLRYLGIGLLAYLALLPILAGTGFLQQALGLEGIRSLQPTLKGYRFPVLLGLFATGTFLEEILYRGYLIERVTQLTGRRWFAAFISWLAFTLVHLRWVGVGPLLDIAVTSAAFVILYVRGRSTWPCIVLHGINSTVAYILGPLLMP